MPPRGGPQRGDHTGQVKEQLVRDHADELVQRSGELGMVTAVDQVIESEGIFDPQTGKIIEIPPDAQAKIDAAEAVQYVTLEDDPIYELGEGPDTVDLKATFQPTQVQQVAQSDRSNPMEVVGDAGGPMIVEKEWRVIRVNTDIEDMTYGAGTSWTFLRGKRYRVPHDLYEWLENRQVIYH